MSARTDLLDTDGENRAVRSFLLMYGGCTGAIEVARMRDHMDMAGWKGCWPDWVQSANQRETLTKAGAQLWIRHLIALESSATAPVATQPAVAGDWDSFKAWAEVNLGQGYSLESEEGVYSDKVTRWAFNGFKAGRRAALAAPVAQSGALTDAQALHHEAIRAAEDWANAAFCDARNVGRGGPGLGDANAKAGDRARAAINALAAPRDSAAPAAVPDDLMAALRILHGIVPRVDDCGPTGEGWQSDELACACAIIEKYVDRRDPGRLAIPSGIFDRRGE